MTTFQSTYESVETFESVTTTKTSRRSSIRSRRSSRRSSNVARKESSNPGKTKSVKVKPKINLEKLEPPIWSNQSPFNDKISPMKVSLEDVDELIASLSAAEIEELALVDPDDSSMPPSMRCLYNCEKDATGDIDRSAMLRDLHEKAVKTPDIEDQVKFVPGLLRGKKFVPKEDDTINLKEDMSENAAQMDEIQDVELSTLLENAAEYDEYIANATDLELREVADILGLTYQNDCLATELKRYPDPPPNDSNVNEIIQRVQSNDPDLIEINLNNIKGIGATQWQKLFDGLAKNDHVESLTAANCDISDTIAQLICECLHANQSLRFLTLDSNSISGEMILKLIQATSQRKTLEELRVSNQQLVKLGLTMEFRDTLNRTAVQLQRNLDQRRQTEQQKKVTLRLDRTKGPTIEDE
eukprot:TCALIF_07247-PA protein Name:"Similar to Tmod2 Tropomodulin-2 (Mus musculus)" AED:0.05 eAED:0.05 QI:154/0.83/0.85/1/1/1/7/232/412